MSYEGLNIQNVVLTRVTCGQLVTNMVNMGGYQKHSEN